MAAISLMTLALLCSCGEKTGQTELTWIEDKPAPSYQARDVFPEVADSLWTALGIPQEGVPSSISCVLLQTGGKNILIDAGLGAPSSQLLSALSAKGLLPEDIDCLFLTHLHGDHIGGLLKDNNSVFPDATVYIEAREAEAWKSMPQEQNALQMSVLKAYDGRIKLFNAGDTLEGGVRSIAAYGHTPGHTVFEKDGYLIIGDLIHGAALQIPYPEYCAYYDMDRDEAIAVRKRILSYAAENHLKVYGMHLPVPGTLPDIISERDGDGHASRAEN